MPFAAPLLRSFGFQRPLELEFPLETPLDEPTDPAIAALIGEIRAYNPSARLSFLTGFDRRALETYLEHLASAREPRGRTARWVRPGDTPAMVLRQQHD